MSSTKLSTVAAGAAIISAGTLISRLLGLVRENMLYNAFPDRLVRDSFLSAFLVPDTLYFLLAGGALSAAFIPVFSGYLAKERQEDANRVANSIVNLLMLAIMAGLVLLFIFAPGVVRLVAPGYAPGSEKYFLTVILAREMCAMIIFTALSGLFTGMLNSYHHFLMPVVVWNTYNIGIIIGIKYLSQLPVPAHVPAFLHWTGLTLGIHGAAIGVLLGAISLAVLQLPAVFKYGFRYSPIIDTGHEGVRRVLILFLPVMIGLALSQVNLLMVPIIFGSLLSDGSVAAIRAANRLVLLPLGLFAMAIAVAAFPTLAQQISLGKRAAFRDTLSQSLKVIILLVLPSAVALAVLAEPIIGLLYGGKGYGITDIQAAGFTLVFYTVGLLGLSLMQLINRGFYSLQDTITPVIVGLVMVVSNVLLAILLIRETNLSYGAVALASSVTSTIGAIVLFDLLRRRMHGMGGQGITTLFVKTAIACLVMGIVLYLVAKGLAPIVSAGTTHLKLNPVFPVRWPVPVLTGRVAVGLHVSRLRLLVQIGMSGILGIAVYLGTLKGLGVEEVSLVLDRFTKKFRRSAPVEKSVNEKQVDEILNEPADHTIDEL